MKTFIFLILIAPFILFAKEPLNDGNTFTIVSKDSAYILTSATKNNFRYRAVFYQDYHNEVPGGLYIEKIQRPNSMGLPYMQVWKRFVKIEDMSNLKKDLAKLGFEKLLGCCEFVNLRWSENFNLNFNITIKSRFSCTSEDVRKGKTSN